MYNVEGKIGGDSDLSPRGWEYARALPDLIKENIGDADLTVSPCQTCSNTCVLDAQND